MDSDNKYAGFWLRFIALIIDGLVVGVPCYIVLAILGITSAAFAQLAYIAAGIGYYVYFLSSPWQATLGKRIMGVYIVRAGDQGRLTHAEAFKRYAVFAAASLLLAFYTVVAGDPTASMLGIDEARMQEIQTRAAQGQLSQQDQRYLEGMASSAQNFEMPATYKLLALINLLYALALAFSVGLTKEKTGIHDMAVKTRALKGKTAAASFKG